jgi:MFS family permease
MLLAGFGIVLESSVYSAVAPVLPRYEDELGLSKSAAGVLIATYTAGTIMGSITGALLVGRLGARFTTALGFGVLAVSSVVFGVAGDLVVLDAARAVQGFGAGLIWSALLAWLITAAPANQRGRTIGAASGAAIFGTLLGPVLGLIAVSTSPQVAFMLVAAGAALMVPLVLRTPAPARTEDAIRAHWGTLLRSGPVITLGVLILLPGIVYGAVNALVPLRLDDAGLSHTAIGATFLVGAGLAALLSPSLGRRSDQHGRVGMMLVGVSVLTIGLVLLGMVSAGWAIAVVTVTGVSAALPSFFIPLIASFSEVAERFGMPVGAIAAMINVAFAGGETMGAPLSAITADRTSDGVPFLALAVISLTAALVIARRASRSRPSKVPVTSAESVAGKAS